ncbi:MAG: YeeE/YedE family protein [Leptospiraceae bacterium]|nr:YeeE/YedE family protein [Leptospiraceae bacterium]MCP5495681.1 YeeE/YedE family protein [Leptospiraceae bacterium]
MNDDLIQNQPKPYLNPYLAGVGLGIVLLLSYVFMGRGLGASGAITRMSGYAMIAVAPEHTKSLKYMNSYFAEEKHILNEYLVFLLAGVFVGGFVSGALANRIQLKIDKGPTFSPRARLVLAFVGGGISAIGARLARGCTSGQALSGGATLALGSWIFIIGAFAGGYAVAYFVRRQWQ